jgi:DNA-binding transcriptional ArsR family regulator
MEYQPFSKTNSKIMSQMASGLRSRILRLLLAKGELTVSEIYQTLGMSQPNISIALNGLLASGVVENRKKSTNVYYRFSNKKGYKELFEAFCKFDESNTGRFRW